MNADWERMLPALRERAYRHLDHDPEILFEQDGHPGVKADYYFARLLGHDDQIVTDMAIPRIEPEIRLPIPERARVVLSESLGPYPTIRTARYVVQNCYVLTPLAYEFAPADAPRHPDFKVSVCWLRYRRKL